MKIAFVNQAIDTIIPPGQNSVGACTYGVANILAKSCDVVVYGAKYSNQAQATEVSAHGVKYKFFATARSDQWLFDARTKYSKLAPSAPPISTSSLLYPSFAKQVAMDLQREACDIIHIQHCSQCVPVIREYNPRAKIVLHLHAEWFSQGDSRVFERRLKDVDLVSAVSGYVAGKTRRDFPAIADRCEVIYNGIDSREFIREKDYAVSEDKPKRILYAGAISPHRGLHVLLEAFKIVVKRYPNVRLDLVGPEGNYALQDTFDIRDGALRKSVAPYYAFKPMSFLKAKLFPSSLNRSTYRSYLESMMPAEVAEKTRFHGLVRQRAQLIEHYYTGDVFVLPSVCNDSFGIPVVEAMAAGSPVVASRSGGVVETVKDRDTGFIVEKNDPEQLAHTLLRLLEDDELREKMGRAGRERALAKFTWDMVAETMLSRYRSISGSAASIPIKAPLVPLMEYASANMAS
ncbi:MAG: spore coat protein [Acidobacteriaceae bacterium]|jgi:glycosyltransferase involved in cell wall biosynthesis|nr:spore coat protein [Acidobacteriaceae bacterium]MDX6462927.1 spore coat protein [Acidobacteriaceae bacterium]